MTIGHLVSVSKEHEMVNPIFADFIAGASARYAQSGYDLLLSLVPDEDEFTSYKELACALCGGWRGRACAACRRTTHRPAQ
jgi:LacI family transcriptional regulator